MKNIVKLLFIIGCLILFNINTIYAVEFEGNEAHYNNLCASLEAEANKAICSDYMNYLQQKRSNFNQRIEEVKKQLAQAENNSKTFQIEINRLQAEIDALNERINILTKNIDELTAEIDKNQKEVDAIRSKVLKRMVNMQPSMRFNPYIDFLMGAKNFNDLISRSNGIKAIMSHDYNTNQKLDELVKKLNSDKLKLEKDKKDLDDSKLQIINHQEDLIIKKAVFDELVIELKKNQEDLMSQGAQLIADINSIRNSIGKVGKMPTAAGWGSVIGGNWYYTSGTWYYDTGGRHLGVDFGASVGTDILAPANGVVVQSYNGCDTYGWLGNSCGMLQGLGNQVRLVVTVNGSLYGITIGHMKLDTPISVGTQVYTGEKIGEVGSSGSSTGPHAHVEIVYLGEESYWQDDENSAIDNYISSWDGHLSFGAARYSGEFLDFACENKSTAPCRLRPETIFGS